MSYIGRYIPLAGILVDPYLLPSMRLINGSIILCCECCHLSSMQPTRTICPESLHIQAICDLCRIQPMFDFKTASTITTSIVHAKLDYCSSCFINFESTQIVCTLYNS